MFATLATREDCTTTDFPLDRLTAPKIVLLRALAGAAGARGRPALVGGAVRDGLLGRSSVDVDTAVAAGALELARNVAARLDGHLVILDDERGTARVLAFGHRLDVANFRAPTLAADLAGRDFTVNALGVPLDELLGAGRAPIVDPTGGLADLRARRLRLASREALDDDPLRALRGVRLEASLGFSLDAGARRAIRKGAGWLARVSAERVRDELLAILALDGSARVFRRLDVLRMLPVVLPEVEPMRSTEQPAPHRFPVLEHSLRAMDGADRVLRRLGDLAPHGADLAAHMAREVAGGIVRGQVLRLAALLHDISKPETRRLIDGRIRFFEHDLIGAERVAAIGARWRLPARVSALLERLVRHHLRPMHLEQAGQVTRRARYRFFRDLGEDARDLLLLALVDAAAVRGESPLALWRRARLIRDLLRGWQEEQASRAARPLLRGEDVMQHFGLVPGPRVGRLLERAREAQALGLVGSPEEALAFLDSSPTDL
jgi:putative nucleotidyltransferase with HDIG domain